MEEKCYISHQNKYLQYLHEWNENEERERKTFVGDTFTVVVIKV